MVSEADEAQRVAYIREVMVGQAKRGLDIESFLSGLCIALGDRSLGKLILAAFVADDEAKARLEMANGELIRHLRSSPKT